jgi:hypothetical protein
MFVWVFGRFLSLLFFCDLAIGWTRNAQKNGFAIDVVCISVYDNIRQNMFLWMALVSDCSILYVVDW